MYCNDCKAHLSACDCSDVTERLRKLAASDYVYVGNIIDARIETGVSSEEDFEGVNKYHPYARPLVL